MKTGMTDAIILTLIMSAITFATRLLPFALFRVKRPPSALIRAENLIPPAILIILVAYALQSQGALSGNLRICGTAASAVVILLHLAFRNALVSIFSGTAAYMFLRWILGA